MPPGRLQINTSTTQNLGPQRLVSDIKDTARRTPDNQRIGAPDLFPVRHREIGEGGDVVGGLTQHGFDPAQLAAEHTGDGVELLTHMLGVGLGEDGSDGGAAMLKPTQQLVGVKYFTARVRSPAGSQVRQNTYLDALAAATNTEIIFGRLQHNAITCNNCQTS